MNQNSIKGQVKAMQLYQDDLLFQLPDAGTSVIDFLFLFFRSVFVCGQNFVRGGHSYKNVMVIRLDHNTNRDIAATDVIETIGLLTYDDAHH